MLPKRAKKIIMRMGKYETIKIVVLDKYCIVGSVFLVVEFITLFFFRQFFILSQLNEEKKNAYIYIYFMEKGNSRKLNLKRTKCINVNQVIHFQIIYNIIK